MGSNRAVFVGIGVGATIGAVIVIAVTVAVVYTTGSSSTSPSFQPLSPPLRIDCAPDQTTTVSKSVCESRGCAFDADKVEPICSFPDPSKASSGYDSLPQSDTDRRDHSFPLKSRGGRIYDSPIPNLRAVFQPLSNEVLRLKIFDEENSRYEVPTELNLPTGSPNAPKYKFNVTSSSPFAFDVKRQTTDAVIFDTSPGGFVFENQFIQIVTRLASTKFYGLGENLHTSLRHNFTGRKTWASFTRDSAPNRKELSTNLYGVHPFYLVLEDDGKAHGVFIKNSNAMEFGITPAPYFVYRTLGGILDIFYIVEDSPELVVKRYHELIGKPYMPPLWSLGFHLSRYGFTDLAHMQRAVNRTMAAKIPLDVIHADIDHMDERKVFTIDDVNFGGLPEYVKSLRTDHGIHTIIILDPFIITNETNYRPFELGKKMDAFIRWRDRSIMPANDYEETGSTMMLGFVWPKGKVVFPDYLRNSTKQYWKTLIKDHHNVLNFDGLWIDMNEPANFGTNQERPFNWPEKDRPYWSLKCPGSSDLENPPYRTMAMRIYDSRDAKAQLSDKSLCMDGVQGEDAKRYSHYNVHSLYGWSMTRPTFDALRETTGKRGLVLTRSTFPGSGHYAGHWLGDNDSQWPGMAESVVGMMEFNMFGYNFVGADICGFFMNTTEELCTRWMQLGAFYPFSRNHNTIGVADQDPGVFSRESTEAMRRAMEMRYRLMPYLYTLFMKAAMSGGTVVRPLFFEYPTDPIAADVDQQFMWGSKLIISPVLRKGQRRLDFYLPSGTWYRMTDSKVCQYPSGNLTYDESSINYSKLNGSQWLEKSDVSIQSIPEIHLRGGSILFTKQPQITTSKLLEDRAFHMIIALNEDSQAEGELYWDDGNSIDDDFQNVFQMSVTCTRAANQVRCNNTIAKNPNPSMRNYSISSAVILGSNYKRCVMNGREYTAPNIIEKNGNLLCYFDQFNMAPSLANPFLLEFRGP